MLPAAIVPLQELPRTERGKIDRDALKQTWGGPGTDFRAPRTDKEMLIAQIWADVLGLDEIGVDDDFFELGGDSLAVEEVLSQLQAYGPNLPTSAFIRGPTVAGLAKLVEETSHPAPRAEAWSKCGGRRRATWARPTVFCFAGAGGVVLSLEALVRRLDLEWACTGFRCTPLSPAASGLQCQSGRRPVPEGVPAAPRPAARTSSPGTHTAALWHMRSRRRMRAAGNERRACSRCWIHIPRTWRTARWAALRQVTSKCCRRRLAAARSAMSAREAYQLLRILTAGPIRYRGRTQYELFEGRGYHLQRLYRASPTRAGRWSTSRNETRLAIDHLRWQRYWLRGPSDMSFVPGDHFTMLREPFVRHLAADLRERIR